MLEPHDHTHIDGNGVAGLLAEIGETDMTTVMRTCQSCHAKRLVGEHRAYRGAGIVLRCPVCDDTAIVVVERGHELVVEWRGTYAVQR